MIIFVDNLWNEFRVQSLFFLVNKIKDGLPYLFHRFRNKYFNKISLGNLLCFQNKL